MGGLFVAGRPFTVRLTDLVLGPFSGSFFGRFSARYSLNSGLRHNRCVTDDGGPAPQFSVIIPAHNEEAVIMRLLEGFLPGLDDGEAQVVVVPNGCTDRTAELARSVPAVTTLDVAVASKSAALNAGDKGATAFPRIYVDADVILSAETLRALARVLAVPDARVASPTVRFAVAGRPWTVRAFHRVYEKLPYIDDALIGHGVYGLSASGRARFDEFPSVTADDLFVQRLFSTNERIILGSHFVDVQTPKTLRSLLAIRTRTAYGNRQLAVLSADTHGASTRTTIRALVGIIRAEPRIIPDAAVYIAVTATARLKAKRKAAGVWQRDTSNR
jgi:glycosyltransferase involved in cell wall biosynthesis